MESVKSSALLGKAHSGIRALTPYKPGKPVDEVKREYGLETVVKLASNENPLGPSSNIQPEVAAFVSEFGRYPDGAGHDLKQVLAAKHGVAAASITLGNGTNELLNLISRLFLSPGAATVFSEHAFIVYKLAAVMTGAEMIEVPAKDFAHDLDAIAAAITSQTRVVFLANPNNPTGTYFGKSEFSSFMAKVPSDVAVVLDEAYFDYVDHSDALNGAEEVERYENLIVTRTFSKVYGLGALRIGYALSSEPLADLLNRGREPFNTNAVAQLSAVLALADSEHTQKSVELNSQGMSFVTSELESLGLEVIKSYANFLTIDVADGPKVAQALLEKGVIVRPVAEYGLPKHIRVTLGTADENKVFIDTLKQVLA